MDMPEYLRVVDLCDRVVRAARSDDGGPTVAGTFLGQLADLLDPVDEKGRGETYWRGHADGRMAERAGVAGGEQWTVTWVDSGTIDRESGEVIPAGWWVIGQSDEVCDEYAFSTIHVEFSYDEHGHDITERIARRVADGLLAQNGVVATARFAMDEMPGPRYREVLDTLSGAHPPFAPELADAPIVTGESGAPAPLVVDHPVHESTLPEEASRYVTVTCVGCGARITAEPDRYGRIVDVGGCREATPVPPTGRPDA